MLYIQSYKPMQLDYYEYPIEIKYE